MAVGLFEYFLTDAYLHIFNVLRYYMSRGMVNEAVTEWVQKDTFVSGVRMAGRNLLPFLGDLRVSSVFLEPVSMGNYAIVVCVWALSFDVKEWRRALPHFMVALILIVACDSRFASLLVFFLVVCRFIPFATSRGVLLLLPIATVAGLAAFTLMGLGNAYNDDLPGRLMRSGEAMLDMSFGQLMGYVTPDPLFDMGVAYSLENLGLILCVVLWVIFVRPKQTSAVAQRLRLQIGLYAMGILLVSGTSLYSSKTAVLLWFMYGVVAQRPSQSHSGLNLKLPFAAKQV